MVVKLLEAGELLLRSDLKMMPSLGLRVAFSASAPQFKHSRTPPFNASSCL
jgi:hypothetical protein